MRENGLEKRVKNKRMKKMKKRLWQAVSCALCMSIFFTGMSFVARAEGKAVILQSFVKEENICLFLGGLETYETVTGQIGREAAEIVNVDTDIARHTIILIDNSLSVTKENFAKSKEILRQFLEEKAADEEISLAVYGTDIRYLTERESDADKVIAALESITSEDKDTYLTDVLYDELQKLENKTEYTRFIVVTDGVDNKEIGYTKEELSAYLKENAYPIYTFGCKYKENDEQLKNLFAIARATNAGYYLLDEYEEYDEIVENLCEAVICVEMQVPDVLKDGSSQNILLTFEGTDGKIEVAETISMPFGLKEPEPEPAPEPEREPEPALNQNPEPVSNPEPIPEPEPLPAPEPEAEEKQLDFISIGAGIVIVAALAVLIIVNVRKKSGNKEGKDKKRRKKDTVLPIEDDRSRTVIGTPIEEEGATVFLGNSGRAGYIVVLRDKEDSSKVFRYPLADKVVIGRKMGDGVNIVLNYEATVSAKHCEISRRGERFYVKDLHSSNKTFLNGQQVMNDTEFTSGSALQMGNLKMTIEIEQVRQ